MQDAQASVQRLLSALEFLEQLKRVVPVFLAPWGIFVSLVKCSDLTSSSPQHRARNSLTAQKPGSGWHLEGKWCPFFAVLLFLNFR